MKSGDSQETDFKKRDKNWGSRGQGIYIDTSLSGATEDILQVFSRAE